MKAILVCICLISLMSCVFEKESDNNDSDDGARQSQNNLKVPFPHPLGFKNAGIHGSAYLKSKSSCISCHGDDKTQAKISSAPKCNSCHSTYPHIRGGENNWLQAHGKTFLKSFKSKDAAPNQCSKCHDSLLEKSAGLKISCDSCHTNPTEMTFPHTKDFKEALNHGQSYLKNKQSCKLCHNGNDNKALGSSKSGPNCNSCHTDYPHISNGSSPWLKSHGKTFLDSYVPEKASENKCILCHNSILQKKTNTQRLSCNSCHASPLNTKFPHPEGFKDAGKHGKLYLKDKQSCKLCHSATKPTELEKSKMTKLEKAHLLTQKDAPSCNSCHAQYPHVKKDNTIWLKKHGEGLHDEEGEVKADEVQSCAKCHDSLLKDHPGGEKLSCNSCHIQMPHPRKWFRGSTRRTEYHGGYVKINGVAECRKCHGEDISQVDVNEGTQYKAQYCSECHEED
jgi:hypothetical protein